jgi:hypothetical protein
MGTPRSRKVVEKAPAKSAGARVRPIRPDSVLHPIAADGIRLPVRPDTRAPVRPISVRHSPTIGAKAL